MKRTWIILALGISLALHNGFADAVGGQEPPDGRDLLTAAPEVVEQWQDMRLGMFVCWGPVTLTGEEIGWSRDADRREPRPWGLKKSVPVDVYDNLFKEWKPDKFDAREWARVAQEAGCKYMIFLVKHHDGYCLYDTKLNDYRSTGPEAAWNHDVMADVAEACRAAGLKLIVYYSQPDWRHPDYRTENHARYIEYLHGQVRELLTNYGRIDGFWFDGLGGKAEDWDAENLFKMMRTLQPWLIINNRCGLPGDYDTPEQKLGAFQLERPWESCITLGTQWSWKPDDKIKSLKECIDILVTCAGRNGNLALNTNPMPNGQIEPRQVERFQQIGRWLEKNGESIYQTRGGPFWGLNCLSTRKGNTIYVHVLKWYDDALVLPPLPRRIVSHRLLTGGEATVVQTDEGVVIEVPREHRNELDTIIALELDGATADLEPARVDWGPLTFSRPATASHQYDAVPANTWRYTPAKAVDGDPRSGWTVNPDVSSAWLEVDLGKEATFDRAMIDEPLGRVGSFKLQVKRGDAWRTFHEGGKIGKALEIRFPAVTGRHVRLHFADATVNPLITEFHLYPISADERQKRLARLEWFNEAKYGLFINWGLYSIPAGEWKGKPVPWIGEWIMYSAKIPVKEYEKLAEQFNPTRFDAEEWVLLAKDAGMKYLVFDCKHHDGFALYHSKVSKYNVVDATPFRRDPMKELAEACKKHGIKLCFYYSQAQDWHEPNGAGNNWDFAPNEEKDFGQYLRDKSLPQVEELLRNYGPIGLIWFDTPRLMTREHANQFSERVRSIQPGTLINSRLGPGDDIDYRSMGDNQIPHTVLEGAWETAATTNDTWGYKKDDHNWKTPAEVTFKLVDIVSKGGNYLLNVGPTADGVIPEPSQKLLRRVGQWLKINGEAVYDAGRTPFGDELGTPIPGKKDNRGQQAYDVKKDWRCTTKPGRLYIHFFTWPTGRFELEGLKDKVVRAYLLADPERRSLTISQDDDTINVRLPAEPLDDIATVLCLELDKTPATPADE